MLNHAKVERLLTDLSGRARAETAAIVSGEFVSGELTDAEQRIALDIVTVLAGDVDQSVRETLAESVKSCPFLPVKVGMILARDLDPVAIPILRNSPIFSDRDLIAIIGLDSTAKQIAIARRERVAAAVSAALVETRKRKVVKELLANQGAILSEATLSILVARYSDDRVIQLMLGDRPGVPAGIIERLLECASAEVSARLLMAASVPAGQQLAASTDRRDRAFSDLLAGFSPAETERLALELHEKKMLPPLLLLRCLSDGHLLFFEAAVAALASTGLAQARSLLHDRGALGLPAIIARAHLPACLFPAFQAVIGTIVDAVSEGGAAQGGPDRDALVAKLQQAYPSLSPGSFDHVLGQLSLLVSGSARAEASAKS